MPVTLTRAIRFASGAILRFNLALNETLLETLQDARPQVAAVLAAARAARVTIESLDDDACRLRIAQFQLDVFLAGAEGYTLTVAWADPVTSEQRRFRFDGIALMLGGHNDVFFAQRVAGESRVCLKLSYAAEPATAQLYAFPAAFAGRVPAVLRALLPSQLALGTLSSA